MVLGAEVAGIENYGRMTHHHIFPRHLQGVSSFDPIDYGLIHAVIFALAG